ncbi:ABC transporter substrate-binding protein [Clostridium aminobutyricum]|uniref:ABC transporter substrate-binding protein n=1 Tax=Clostridium aminobutyricum TaxID=33953 RepID=A0A939IGV4_CLOAM|nr:ABC transporter substrate-binding protein [Clostridium aminobutyricum]MBN7773995.1 ABC transporter substrate-binding protein [Clostridium aminobutyricum]
MKKLVTLITIITLIGTIFSGCSGNGANQSKNTTIKIGLAAPISGAEAQYGEAFKKGAELAVQQLNDSGGIDGKKIEIVTLDDKGDSNEAVNVANKFASDNSIVGIIGHFNSSATLAAAPIYNKNKVVTVSPSSSSPNVTDAGDYIFRVITTDAFQADYLAKWSKEEGHNKVAIIYEQTDFGLGLSDVYSKAAKENNIEIVANETYVAGQTKDFSTIVTKIKGKQPDAIFIGGVANDAALVIQQAKKLGVTSQFIGVDSLYSDALIQLGGSAVEDVKLVGFFHPGGTNEQANDFLAAYENAYNKKPDTYAAYAYDATSVLIEAIKQNGADREDIKKYLSTLQNFKGATGTISFDENGDVLTEPQKLIVSEGQFLTYNK